MAPMWGFWWIFPLIGLVICLLFVFIILRVFDNSGRLLCMGPHQGETDEIIGLRKEVEQLREEVKKQASVR
jgi:hypothetical protein